MDLDLRLVRYFTVVAEHLSFGRAATALHLAQPALSRQIQRLERQLGVRLLDRTPQGSSLTEAGRAFLPEALALLAAAERARRTATSAVGAIAVGCVGDLLVTPAVRELCRRYPRAEVRTRHLSWRDADALAQHRVDAVVTRVPVPGAGLRITPLYEEPRVLVVSRDHRLAGKDTLSIGDLAGEDLVACASSATIWSARVGADDSFEDKLELVADGRGVGILPAGDRRSTLRDDLATIPLDGIQPCQVVAATRGDDPNPLTDAFHEVARAVLGRGGEPAGRRRPVPAGPGRDGTEHRP